MGLTTSRQPGHSRVSRWLRLAAGAAGMLGLFLLLARGYAPPGPAGDVIRHNLAHGIDATPLFYTEIESSYLHDYAGLFVE